MKYSIKSVVEALEKSNGLISVAARSLGCSQTTIKNYRKKYPEVEQAIQDHRCVLVDAAQGALFRAVLNGDITAIIFTLKALGKDRGFVEKQQIEHSGEIGAGVLKVPRPASSEEWSAAAAIVSEKQEEAVKGVS